MKNDKTTIFDIVKYINNPDKNGGFWLPNIQRQFVWSEEQIYALFDSIMRGYPISNFLIWETKSEIQCRKFIENYEENVNSSHVYIPKNNKLKNLILDGQQRLQSIFIALKGSYGNVNKELYFDVLSGILVKAEEIKYKFKFVDNRTAKLPWIKIKDILFDEDHIGKISKKIKKQFDQELTEKEEDIIDDNISILIQNFKINQIISYQVIDEPVKEEEVVEIFIRANSGGTKLGKSDLLFSLLTTTWEEAEVEIEDLLDELNKTGYEFTRDFILKTCLTLLDKGARYEVNKFRNEEVRQDIIKNWDKITDAIKKVKDFLSTQTFLRSDKALPSYLTLIPLIYFIYHYPNEWKKSTDKKDIKNYLFRTLISGAFSGNPDNLIDKCIETINQKQTFDVTEIFQTIRNNGRNLEISQESILSENYTSKSIHLLFNIWYPQADYTSSFSGNALQIDHIFPQSSLKKETIVNPETGRQVMKYQKEQRNQIANCMLLTREENLEKTDKPLKQWLKHKRSEFNNDEKKLEKYLKRHLIPTNEELWEMDKFEEFIEARKALILEEFKFLLST
ncbi:DUF262 domain-containing protein [Geminocystis sp.]|uniref:DUF262 domain-containing protein n=1 Tax=Geminocystis sp. TaxID=2664100 RepID=UPI0035947A76